MTKLSQIKIEERHYYRFLNNFLTVITLLENKNQVKDFLGDMLTHTEIKMLTKRLQIAKMLLEGFGYQEIKNYVKVTDNTIAKINNILARENNGLKTAVLHLQKIEEDMDKKRMRITPDLKEKYGAYFIPERLADKITQRVKKEVKKHSVKKM